MIRKALQIHGWMTENELKWLANRANETKTIIEVGCYEGRSTRALADNTSGIIHAVDPWNGKQQYYGGEIHQNGDNTTYSKFHCNLADHINSGRVKIHRQNFHEFSLPLGEYADLVFIDAIHEYNALIYDCARANAMLAQGGIIAGHDYSDSYWPEVKKFVDEFYPDKQVEDTIWWIQK